MSTNTVLRDLRPDTEYKVTLVPIYDDMEGKRMSENGKTSEFSPSRDYFTQTCPGLSGFRSHIVGARKVF